MIWSKPVLEELDVSLTADGAFYSDHEGYQVIGQYLWKPRTPEPSTK